MQDKEIKSIDYFELWKYFSEDAAHIKDKLWTISSWLFTLLSGILGFIAKNFEQGLINFTEPVLIAVAALIGLIMSIYTFYMITEYGKHIRTAWNRTNFLRNKIEGLQEVWESGHKNSQPPEQKTDSIPPFVKRLRWLALSFMLAFVIVLLFFSLFLFFYLQSGVIK